MKAVTPQEMKRLEELAYTEEEVTAEDLMQEAGYGVASIVEDFIAKHHISKRVVLVCGKGNNAGDAYVCGIELLKKDYEVLALQMFPFADCNALCQSQGKRFTEQGGFLKEVRAIDDLILPSEGIIVDGLFGTGFKGELQEPLSSLVFLLNHSHLPIIAIDIPSGLNAETGEVQGEAIVATETAFLALPKQGFFFKDGWNHVGVLKEVDIGLSQNYIDQAKSNLSMLSAETLRFFQPRIKRSRHKYERGYVVGIAGSPGMPGAAILSSWASLVGGAGITRLFHPEEMDIQLAAAPFEIIKTPFAFDQTQELQQQLQRAKAVFIGPGLGRTAAVGQFLKLFFSQLERPCVIDADALYFLSQEKPVFPKQAILTPHKGEMQRLLGKESEGYPDEDFIHQCQAFAQMHQVTIVLKGGPTFILQPDEPVIVCPRGDPGMATAGSGDVLTGLIAALLAQGLSTGQAAVLGTYLHGVAGELAAEEKTSYSVLASDILTYLPKAFKQLSSGH